MNKCELNHGTHTTHIVTIPVRHKNFNHNLQFEIYDAERYKNSEGYCTGDDAVSRVLVTGKPWEYKNTKLLLDRNVFQGGIVVDVGCHIGWYTILAAKNGCYVYSYDADEENLVLLLSNSVLNGVQNNVFSQHCWVDENWTPTIPDDWVDLIKIDIEGAEKHAVEAFWQQISEGAVKHILLEVSPVFKEGYPELVEQICSAGFKAEIADNEPKLLPSYEWVKDCYQADIFFTKVD